MCPWSFMVTWKDQDLNPDQSFSGTQATESYSMMRANEDSQLALRARPCRHPGSPVSALPSGPARAQMSKSSLGAEGAG